MNANPVPGEPRDVSSLFGSAFQLYGRYPALFALLACGVIVPFDLIVLAAAGAGPYTQEDASIGAQVIVGFVEAVVIGPLVSALHVHAVSDVRNGREPEARPVALRGLRALPVVAAAVIMSTLGIALGLVALIVPGVILFFRWFVVAQVAALDGEGWLESLRGSRRLTAGNYGHIFVFVLILSLITAVPSTPLILALGQDNTVPVVGIGMVVHVFVASFTALTTALLYFDLVARRDRVAPEEIEAT